MDYNLHGLSTRSFEQLIQSITAKLIGPQVIIFGDGPDGGREATFEDAIPYPSRDSGWSGFGIVQAKFRQRLQGTKEDGAWAVQQLRSELKAFLSPKKRKRKPEYYIFVTNVVLTAVEEKGGKDQCIALLEEFSSKLPLKGYDIWDYDKLRVFLDDNEEIRRGYSAWITPGDVLSEVIKWFSAGTPNFDHTLTSFLEKELLSDQYVNLEQAGYSGKDATPIARVFVDLPASEQNLSDPPKETKADALPPGIVAEIIASSNERLDPKSLGLIPAADSVARTFSIDKKGRYVITGGPGQGKTTVGQFICQLFRAAILKDKPDWQLDPETRQILNTLNSQIGNESLQFPTARRFPIRVVLSQFAKALAAKDQENINSVLSYVVDLIRKRTDQNVSVNDFKRWLSEYPWLIVFDGLDEVPASSNRDEVLAAIRDFRIDARRANADLFTIGTTRPQGYNADFNPDLHHQVWLTPLSTARAMHYAERLVEVRFGNDKDRVQKILSRLWRASENESTARLMRSPLQVTIMATLVDRMGQPPQERWNLFKEYYRVIYQREVERDIPAAVVLRDHQPNVDTIHNHVGLLLQLESGRSGQTDARLSKDQFEAVVDNRLKEEGYTDKELTSLKTQIIEAATDRLVFLVGLQADQVGFEIRSLQEFMAAEALMNENDDLVRKRLREIAPISNWRNVFLFAAGKCFAERQHLRDTIHLICGELNEDPTDRPLVETLQGSRLALDLLEDGPARRQPKYAQSLARIALRLLDQPPQDEQIKLAALCDSGLETVYQEELELRISQVDHNRRLGAWTTLIPLVEKKISWACQIADSYWPREASPQLDIVLAGLNSTGGWWLLSKFQEVIPKTSPLVLAKQLGDDYLRKFASAVVPRWLTTVLNVLFSTLEDMPNADFVDEPDLDGLFSIRWLMVKNEWLAPLKKMPNPSPEWSALITAAEFSEAPSTENMFRTLETILENSNNELSSWLVYRLPWPLASALAFAQQAGLLHLKKLAADGGLGDINVWSGAETRWGETGFGTEDILFTASHLPFEKDIAQMGFPFAGNITVTITDDLPLLIPTLLSVYSKLEDSPLRPWVAGWILFVLSVIAKEYDSPEIEVPSLEEFRTLISDSAILMEDVYIDGIKLIDFGDELDADGIDFLDWLGQQDIDIVMTELEAPGLSNLLAKAFKSSPERVGLLRAHSFWITEKTEVIIPTPLLNCDKYAQTRIQEAALIVRLMQGRWSGDDIPDLARWSANFINRNLVSNLLWGYVPISAQVTWDLYARLLIEMRKLLPSSEWRHEAKIIQRLNDSIRRRSCRLTDQQVWMELGMPKGLLSLLPPPQI